MRERQKVVPVKHSATHSGMRGKDRSPASRICSPASPWIGRGSQFPRQERIEFGAQSDAMSSTHFVGGHTRDRSGTPPNVRTAQVDTGSMTRVSKLRSRSSSLGEQGPISHDTCLLSSGHSEPWGQSDDRHKTHRCSGGASPRGTLLIISSKETGADSRADGDAWALHVTKSTRPTLRRSNSAARADATPRRRCSG